jgi:hypothetical protein
MKKQIKICMLAICLVFSQFYFIGCDNPSTTVNSTETTDSPEEEVDLAAFNSTENDPNSVPNALPFAISFEELTFPGKGPLPRLQSYVQALNKAGQILIVGGRRQGLHTFEPAPANNFQPDSSNNYLFVIDPTTGDQWSFDVNQLDGALSAPLQANNQQGYHDLSTDYMYVVGGYGWLADKSNMITFNNLIRFKVEDMSNAIKNGASAAEITGLIEIGTDDRFAVTGGEFFRMGNEFYLVFGQKFMGQYRGFGSSNDYSQEYTEEVRVFTLKPNSVEILSYGAQTNSESDHPFHRRDGNIIEDIDPATKKPRITALGGVFPPGIIGGYTYPIYINGPSTPTLDRSGNQKFSQYECPIISVYNETPDSSIVYHTLFGGIGHYYYHQTPTQADTFRIANDQGRNDGLPYVADITTFQHSSNGNYNEFIHVNPVPGERLLGTSVRFIVNNRLITNRISFSNGVIFLPSIPAGQTRLAGYIFGGIEAYNPLPAIPNTGTFATNTLFAVHVTNTPSAAIPASKATVASTNNNNNPR